MCRMLSGLVLKDKTLYNLDRDNHEDLIKEAGLKDESKNPDFVRVEIVPIDGNVFNHDPKNWQLKVDQDFRPDWFSEKFAESEMRKALQELFDTRFVIGRTIQEIKEGRYFLGKDGVIERAVANAYIHTATDNSKVGVLRGNSKVGELRENSQVGVLRGNSKVGVLRGNSKVGELTDNSKVGVLWGNSKVGVLWGNSHMLKLSSGVQFKEVHDNATVKDVSGKTPIIYVADKSTKLKVWKPKK